MIRDLWPGKLVVKGVQNVEDSVRLIDAGVLGVASIAELEPKHVTQLSRLQPLAAPAPRRTPTRTR